MISNKFAVQDYNFETPDNDLLSQLDAKDSGAFRVYTYPGRFEKLDEGNNIADRRVEAIELPGKILKGSGFCRAFIAGYKFEMKNHDRDDMNGEYVLRRLSVSAGQDGYANFFEAFPADVQFRPPATARKPRISGTQTAEVVGKAGEEIWTDEYGRIKVQFHWDEEGTMDENSSCWIRVAQMWAGKGWGTMYIPRIGAEVVVSFLEGDPDRPLVTGTVYNARQVIPYNMPGDKTKSTIKTDSTIGGGGFNEFRFEDKKGEEEIYLQGQKDWNILIKNDKSQKIDHDETSNVTNNRTKTVGVDQSETIGQNKTIQVGKDHTETVGANMALNVGSDRTVGIGANESKTVAKNSSETVGENASQNIGKNKSVNVGKASSETVALAKALSIGGAYQISVGGASNETVIGLKAEEVGLNKSVNVVGWMSVTAGKTLAVFEYAGFPCRPKSTDRENLVAFRRTSEIHTSSPDGHSGFRFSSGKRGSIRYTHPPDGPKST